MCHPTNNHSQEFTLSLPAPASPSIPVILLPLPTKKSVRFATKIQVFDTITRDDYSTAEVESCWWTPKETKLRQRFLATLLQKAVSNNRNGIVATVCDMQESLRDVVESSLSNDGKPLHSMTRVDTFSTWIIHSQGFRGLERYVAEAAESQGQCWESYQRRDLASAIRDNILQLLKDDRYSVADVSLLYESQSTPSRMFATYLAVADAAYAIQIYGNCV
jgi:hypothetical protein